MKRDDLNLMCVIIGWENGKVEVNIKFLYYLYFSKIRVASSGESLFKTNLGSSIAKIFEYDYKMDGHKHIICVTVEGVVTGFILKHEDIKRMDVKDASAD